MTSTPRNSTSSSNANSSQNSVTKSRRAKRRRRLGEVIMTNAHKKPNFWNGVLTRTQLAQKTKSMESEIRTLREEKKKQEANSDVCVICQDTCLQSEENSTPCGHTFHTGCLLGWLKSHNTCPCCRTSLYDKPDVPNQNTVEHIVENVLSMHANADPTDTRSINIPIPLLYRLGDEISRLTVENALDVDLDWYIEFEEEGGENEETETVVVEEEDEDEEDEDMYEPIAYRTRSWDTPESDNEEEKIPDHTIVEINDNSELTTEERILYMEERRSTLLREIDELLESDDEASTSDMELSTPEPVNTETLIPLTPEQLSYLDSLGGETPIWPVRTPRNWRLTASMINDSSTLFEYWGAYGNVLRELNNRNTFMRAWNGINEAGETNNTTTLASGIWV
jgi:hypothetical protein